MAVQSQASTERLDRLSVSVVEALGWAAIAAGNRPVNSAHLLLGLTLTHGERSEVRQLIGFFGQREGRLLAELPDLDSFSAGGSPPMLNQWPPMTEVADQIYTEANALGTAAPYPDGKVHIPHLMAAMLNVRPDAAIALEMVLPPLPPFWLQFAYGRFLPTSASGYLSSFLESQPPPQMPRPRLIERDDVLAQLDSATSAPGASISVVASPGSGSTALMLEFLQRASGRYPDGVSYVSGMPLTSDAALRVPNGRLLVVDHVASWPSQITTAADGTLVVVGPVGGQGIKVSMGPLSDTAMRQIATDLLSAFDMPPNLADLERLLGLAAGRVDLLATIINGYPTSGRSFEDYLAWVASVPPGPADSEPDVSPEIQSAYDSVGALPSNLQFLLRDAVFLGAPLIVPLALAVLSGEPSTNLNVALDELATKGLLMREPGELYRIPVPVAAATRRLFASTFEPFYFMRVIGAATAAGGPAVTGIPSDGQPVAPLPSKVPASSAPVEAIQESLGYTPTDYAADGIPGDEGLLSSDALHRAADVEAVCMLATLKAAKPPLSIGLFGDWGSGKTFFMRMVADRIMRRSEKLLGGSSVFCTRVKHIWFNAWHYSDAELWASLVTHIFEELAQDPKLTPPSIEEQKTSIDNKIRTLRQSAGADAVQAVLDDKQLQDDLQASRLGDVSIAQLLEVEGGLVAVRNTLQVAWRHLRFWGRTVVAVTFVVSVGALILIITRRDLISLLAILAPAIGSLVALFATPLGSILRVANRASQKLKEAEEQRQAELARLEQERRALDQPVEAFVRMRLESSDYTKRMGLISTARKDFEELSKRLTGSDTDPDRIILYIDDLDRCSAKVVVQVLEAIHLLLAFELFVVIVGVDSRWLVAALEQHLQLVAEQRTGPGVKNGGERASAQDYLEKIFQVPIQVKPMGREDFETLVTSIVGEGVSPSPPSIATPTAAAAQPPIQQATQASDSAVAGAPGASSNGGPGVAAPAAPTTDARTSQPIPPPIAPVTATPTAATAVRASAVVGLPIEQNPATLRLYTTEVNMLKRMSDLIPTPRSTKRLLNTYRLIRAGIDRRALDNFVSGDDSPEPYQAVILLLAIMIGFPDEFGEFFRAIRDGGDKSFGDVLGNTTGEDTLRQKVSDAITDVRLTDDLAVYKSALPFVSRYSFREWQAN